MRKKIKNLIKKRGIKDVVSILSGNSVGYIISMGAMPILTRLYSPEQIGHLSLYASIILVLSVGVCLKYELSIVLPKDDRDAIAILCACFSLAFIISLIIGLLAFVLAPYISSWMNKPSMMSLLLFVPAGLFLTGIYQSLSYWALRMKRFNQIGISWAIFMGLTVISQILLALNIGASAIGLIIGYVLGLSGATAFLAMLSLRRDMFPTNWKNLFETCTIQLKVYKKYPLYSVWPSFLDNFTMTIPILFFTTFFNQAVVGLYSLGIKVLMIPVSVLGRPVSQVYFQRLADELNSENKVTSVVENTFLGLFITALPILLIIPVAPKFFTIIFGEKWLETGYFVRILAPAMIFRFVASPMSVVFGALNKQEISAKWKIMAFISTTIALALSIPFKDPIITVTFLTINDIIIYNLYILMIFKVSDVRLADMIKRAPYILQNWF